MTYIGSHQRLDVYLYSDRRKAPLMHYCFPYVNVDLRKSSLQSGISEHCETTDTS